MSVIDNPPITRMTLDTPLRDGLPEPSFWGGEEEDEDLDAWDPDDDDYLLAHYDDASVEDLAVCLDRTPEAVSERYFLLTGK